MSEELKPCPFCGSEDIEVIGTHTQKQAECQYCGAKTNHMMKDANAIEAWNTRTSGWISVKDKLPPPEELDYYGTGFSVPVFSGNEKEIHLKALRYSFSARGWIEYDFSEGFHPRDFILPEITRWMPLPK